MMLYCYGAFTTTTLKLLNCVSVCEILPAGVASALSECAETTEVLFFAGGVTCSPLGWQFPIWLLFLVLIALPAATVVIWLIRRLLPASHGIGMWAQSLRYPPMPVAAALRDCMTAPFVPRHWHWAAVLVLQRLMMVSVAVFLTTGLTISVGTCFISVWYLLFQVACRPYREDWVNSLAMVTCLCLVGISVLSSASSVFTTIGFDPSGTPLAHLVQQFDILMLVLLCLPLLVFGCHYAGNQPSLRRCSNSNGEGEVRARSGSGSIAALTALSSQGGLLSVAGVQIEGGLASAREQDARRQLLEEENRCLRQQLAQLEQDISALTEKNSAPAAAATGGVAAARGREGTGIRL
jgi:hypothetical protein